MSLVQLVKASRAATVTHSAQKDPHENEEKPFYKIGTWGGCACGTLMKAKRKRRKIVGSPDYLAWLDKNVPGLGKKITKFFKQAQADVLDQLKESLPALTKAKRPRIYTLEEVDEAIDALNFDSWTTLVGVLDPVLEAAFRENAEAGLSLLGIAADESMVEQINERAVEWSRNRAAELVGKKWVDGELVDNPNSKWAITETTREDIRGLITSALEDGQSTDQLADALADSFSFSDQRAEMVARTELAFAHVEGNTEGWRASGEVDQKMSILGSEHDFDDVCNDNAEAGPIPLDGEFPSGHTGPPYHPNCVCDVIPILRDD